MLTTREISAMMKSVSVVVREFVTEATVGLSKHIGELEQRVASIPAGKDGAPGEPGKDGADGRDGRDGIDGKDGAAGEKGGPGEPGIAGKDGAAGRDGKDADPALVAELVQSLAGVRSQMAELGAAVVALKAQPIAPASFMVNETGALVAVYPDGETKSVGQVRGADGIRGASIMDGSVDAAGQLVLRISDGRIVNAGFVRGEPGKAGEPGAKGSNGRDAMELLILPGIDEAKSYAEGVCARYRGGVIRAERQTDPLEGDLLKAGWGVILEGVAEESERAINDGRAIERTTIYTSGKAFTRMVETAAMLYRGTWKEGEYSRGDTVTRDGSTWHCERKTTAMPGNSDEWKLCVKRGNNGRDGKDGARGQTGADGRSGRDLTQMGFDGGKH